MESAMNSLNEIKASNPDVRQIILVADNSIQYMDLVKIADNARRVLPIFLASGENI
jgi:hypothetical protein